MNYIKAIITSFLFLLATFVTQTSLMFTTLTVCPWLTSRNIHISISTIKPTDEINIHLGHSTTFEWENLGVL